MSFVYSSYPGNRQFEQGHVGGASSNARHRLVKSIIAPK